MNINNFKTINLTDNEIEIHHNDIDTFNGLLVQNKLNIRYKDNISTMELTEKNIVRVVELFQPLGYIISDDVIKYYNIIKGWDITNIQDSLLLSNTNNSLLKDMVDDDIGKNPSSILLHDRRIRYQYRLPNKTMQYTSLIEKIAYREEQKLWIDSNLYSLSNLVDALQQLERLPILIILENKTVNKSYKDLISISNALEENNIHDNIGVYFRLPNMLNGKMFNQYISEKKYNSILDEHTKIVVIEYRTLPKFILALGWKPMSVITINMNLRHTKVDTYTNQCDLVINYSTESSLIT